MLCKKSIWCEKFRGQLIVYIDFISSVFAVTVFQSGFNGVKTFGQVVLFRFTQLSETIVMDGHINVKVAEIALQIGVCGDVVYIEPGLLAKLRVEFGQRIAVVEGNLHTEAVCLGLGQNVIQNLFANFFAHKIKGIIHELQCQGLLCGQPLFVGEVVFSMVCF